MGLRQVAQKWAAFGRRDPFWAVLSHDDQAGNRWDPAQFYATGQVEVEEVSALLSQQGERLPRGKGLDFGCGPGRLTQALADRGLEMTGVDISEPMLDLGRKHNRHGDRVKYLHNEQANLALVGDARFDLVISLICLQHMPPRLQHQYLAELGRVVAPGGLLVVQVVNRLLPPRATLQRSRAFVAAANLAPALVLGATYRRQERREQLPVMEMYPMRHRRALKILRRAGLVVLAAPTDVRGGPAWLSRTYVARRSA